MMPGQLVEQLENGTHTEVVKPLDLALPAQPSLGRLPCRVGLG
jgi:hypothetical protein